MFIAHHIVIIDRKFQKKTNAPFELPTSDKRAELGELVPIVRKLGNDNFTHHIVVKNAQIKEQLGLAEGEEC